MLSASGTNTRAREESFEQLPFVCSHPCPLENLEEAGLEETGIVNPGEY